MCKLLRVLFKPRTNLFTFRHGLKLKLEVGILLDPEEVVEEFARCHTRRLNFSSPLPDCLYSLFSALSVCLSLSLSLSDDQVLNKKLTTNKAVKTNAPESSSCYTIKVASARHKRLTIGQGSVYYYMGVARAAGMYATLIFCTS